jgi:hypothetical protein
MKRLTGPIVLASLTLGLVFEWFFYGMTPGISVSLYTALLIGCTFYLAYRFKRQLNPSIYWLAPVTLFFSFMVFVRADPFLCLVNICVVLCLLFLMARLACMPAVPLKKYGLAQYSNSVTNFPFQIAHEFLAVAQGVLNQRAAKVTKSSYTPILRGIALSLPILFVFLLLLSSADLVFKEFVSSLFSPSISPEVIGRGILVGFIASLFTGAYALIFMPSAQAEVLPLPVKKTLTIGATESSIVLGSVSLLFFVFVMVQFTYLFGGSHQITGTEFTYAEYARKGFFELIAVATISLALMSAMKTWTAFRTVAQSLVFKSLSGVLIAEVVVIMISAHLRLNLYEDAYGFTVLRLLSHLFILWLAYAFTQLLYHIINEKNDSNFVFQLFIGALCFLVLLNVINPDNFIAHQNIARFNSTGKIDLNYLSSLSEDATPEIATLLDHPNKDLQKGAAYILFSQRRYTDSQPKHWQSANFGRHRAAGVISDNDTRVKAGESYSQYLNFGAK